MSGVYILTPELRDHGPLCRVVSPATTPAGAGISQVASGIAWLAVSKCCNAQIGYKYHGDDATTLFCGLCDEVIEKSTRQSTPSIIYVHQAIDTRVLIEWVASWTGFAMEDIALNVDWGDE